MIASNSNSHNQDIGGYFELELNKTREYHPNAYKVNTSRNAFAIVVITQKVKKVYLPYYCCDSLIKILQKYKVNFEQYHISPNFLPVKYPSLKTRERLLYINYFGLNDGNVTQLAERFGNNLIIDNSQAFFSKPLLNNDTFYSPRKYFGIPDGSYLYSKTSSFSLNRQQRISNKINYLFGRIESGSNKYLSDYQATENWIGKQDIKKMSKISARILTSINYLKAKKTRTSNFIYLHNSLGNLNQMKLKIPKISVPFCFPFISKKTGLRKFLINQHIYTPLYWPELSTSPDLNVFEKTMVNNLLPLPIDQRYNHRDMDRIIKLVLKFEDHE